MDEPEEEDATHKRQIEHCAPTWALTNFVVSKIAMKSPHLRAWLEDPTLPPIRFLGDGSPSLTWTPKKSNAAASQDGSGEPPWVPGTSFIFIGTLNRGIVAHELAHVWLRDNHPDNALRGLDLELRADALAREWGFGKDVAEGLREYLPRAPSETHELLKKRIEALESASRAVTA